MRRTLLALLVLAILAIGVSLVWLSQSRRPEIPRDELHRSGGETRSCARCHGRQGDHPVPPTHPVVKNCFSCHAYEGS
jgi:hypothetical protein